MTFQQNRNLKMRIMQPKLALAEVPAAIKHGLRSNAKA